MRRTGSRWVYWFNLGYRHAYAGQLPSRRVPSTYELTYAQGYRQGSYDAARTA